MSVEEVIELIKKHRETHLERWGQATKGGDGTRMEANRQAISTLDYLLLEITKRHNPEGQ